MSDQDDIYAYFQNAVTEGAAAPAPVPSAPPTPEPEPEPEPSGLDVFLPETAPEEDEEGEKATEITTPAAQDRKFDDAKNLVYKKWFRTRDKSGFLTLEAWWDADKISVDVGSTEGKDLKGSTKVWTNIEPLLTYLTAVRDGRAAALYPKKEKAGAPSPEAFVYYGGGQMDGKPVSRILKIHYWGAGSDSEGDASSFVVKTGHFEARLADSGAFIPNLSKPLSTNLIKLTHLEIAEIVTAMQLRLTAAHVARFLAQP